MSARFYGAWPLRGRHTIVAAVATTIHAGRVGRHSFKQRREGGGEAGNQTPEHDTGASKQGGYVSSRGCHGYIHAECIRALHPYPLRIRAKDAYPKCIMRRRGEDTSIPTTKTC